MKIADNTTLSFRAKVGSRLLNTVRQEFGGNQTKVDKFVDLFEKTFFNVLDENTVVNIDKKNRYVFSHLSFPKVSWVSKRLISHNPSISENIITECPKIFGVGEDLLFKNIVRKNTDKMYTGELEKFVKNEFKIPKNQKKFLEIINCAKRIKVESPEAKLTNIDFEIMENKILQERAEIPGTLEYELTHSSDLPSKLLALKLLS